MLNFNGDMLGMGFSSYLIYVKVLLTRMHFYCPTPASSHLQQKSSVKLLMV